MISQKLTLEDYFGRCRNTKVITNARGVLVPVSCGHCPDCMAKKSSRYVALANQESLESKKTFFVTLTYNYANAPVMKLVPSEPQLTRQYRRVGNVHFLHKPTEKSFIKCIDVTRRKVHPLNPKCKTYRKTSTYGKEIHRINCSINNKLFKQFYRKSKKKSNIFRERKYPHLYYLCKEDLQKFLKRLRFLIAKNFDTEIRYFAIGEYTPKHFLPHFHLLLYVNEPRLYPILADYVRQCWEYGIADCEPANSNNGVASYVSSYTNSFTKLPDFLNGKQIKPFSLHSRYFGSRTNYAVASFVYKYERIPFENVTYLINGQLREFSLSSQVASYFFPKCYNFVNQSIEVALRVYTAFQYFRREYNTDNPIDITKHILLDPYKKNNLSILTALDMRPIYDFQPAVFLDILETTDKLDDELHISFFNRLYNAILTSKHFYNLTQVSYFDGMPQYKRNKLLYDKIVDFYKQRDYNCLTTQLTMQNEWYDTFKTPDYRLFFPLSKDISLEEYSSIFNNSSFIKSVAFNNDLKYSERVKHKKQNDLNDIFVNCL